MRTFFRTIFLSKKTLIAEQLGLKDCGKVEKPKPWSNQDKDCSPRAHGFCNTVLRVGIEEASGATVKYCWRCQEIIERLSHPRTPHVSKVPGKSARNVVPLPHIPLQKPDAPKNKS